MICLQIGIGQNIVNVFYMIYLVLVILLIISKGIFIRLMPHGNQEGTSPELLTLYGTPWFLRENKDYESEPTTISFKLAFELQSYVKLIELFIAMLLPFQVLTLLSYFNFASSITNLMRVYTRLYPGMIIMGLIGPICILPAFLYTTTNLLKFTSYPEFSSLGETFLQFSLGLSDKSISSFH